MTKDGKTRYTRIPEPFDPTEQGIWFFVGNFGGREVRELDSFLDVDVHQIVGEREVTRRAQLVSDGRPDHDVVVYYLDTRTTERNQRAEQAVGGGEE